MNKNLLAVEKNKMSSSTQNFSTPRELKEECIIPRNALHKALAPAFQMLTVRKEEYLQMIASRIATFSLYRQLWEGPYLFQRLISHTRNGGQDSQCCDFTWLELLHWLNIFNCNVSMIRQCSPYFKKASYKWNEGECYTHF